MSERACAICGQPVGDHSDPRVEGPCTRIAIERRRDNTLREEYCTPVGEVTYTPESHE